MEILGKTVVELKAMLDNKDISPLELREYFTKRIERFDKDLNAFLTLTNDTSFTENGVLSGIPVAIKDNFCTNGIRTTAASNVLKNFIPPYDATVTTKIKKSGVKILGKTNMDAWAHGSSGETSDFGATKNPWNLEHAPGGSSSGSAASVAAYMAPIAIGSETAGSIRVPASWTGLVGLKPTYGRVSRYGVAAMGSSLDSPGPLARSVEDAALMLEVIAGKDLFDATTIDAPVGEYLKEMKEGRKFTIGICDDYFEGVEEDTKNKVNESIKIFERQGHKVKKVNLLHPKYSISLYTIIQRAEVSSNLGRYQGIRYGEDRNAFGKEAKRRSMLGAYTLAHGYYDAYYKKALKIRTLLIEDFNRVFNEVDLIVGPVAPITAIKLGESEKYPFFGELMDQLNEPSSIAGLPAISIPVGLDSKGLPIGMQIIGNQLEESLVLGLAYQYEQETGFHGVMQKGLERWRD